MRRPLPPAAGNRGFTHLRYPVGLGEPSRTISTAAGPRTSSAATALELLRTGTMQPRRPSPIPSAGKPAATAAVAERAAYEESVDRLCRAGTDCAHGTVLETFHMTYETAAKLALAYDGLGNAMADAVPQSLETFGSADADRIAALGADAAILTPEIELDRAGFDDLVGTYVREAYAGLPGFAAAAEAGQVTIRRASEVAEFNYGHQSFGLFKDGFLIGGAGWGRTFNQALYDDVAATGLQQAFGGIAGQDYYVTWPGAGGPAPAA